MVKMHLQDILSVLLPLYPDVDLLSPYHELVQPVISILEQDLGLPTNIASIISLAFAFFSPVYFVAALFFSTFGYNGSVRCVEQLKRLPAPSWPPPIGRGLCCLKEAALDATVQSECRLKIVS
jgi:hypothetical protein